MILDNLEPRAVWEIFETIFASTPRASNHEDKIRARIEAWAAKLASRGVSCAKDKAGNLLLKKGASRGFESWPAILLQGHMDMVCETSREGGFDFQNLPIPIRVDPDGLWVSADGTTLGADDGIGASIALGLLVDEDPRFVHGPIEILLTVAEETGLDGAYQLDPAALGIKSKHMINVDSEEFGVITIGSAGGGGIRFMTKVEPQPKPQIEPKGKNIAITHHDISVSGLRGGHSGVDIHLPRANAIKIVARMLSSITSKMQLFLCSWTGGTRHNAIPRSSTATFAVWKQDTTLLNEIVRAESAVIENYYKNTSSKGEVLEPGIAITLKPTSPVPCISSEKTTEIVRVVNALPHGPAMFSPALPSLVETSDNVAIVNLSLEAGSAELFVSARSNVDTELEAFRHAIASIGQLASWQTSFDDAYPAWTPDPASKFLGFVREKYEKRIGAPVEIRAVHAGLECSVIVAKIPPIARCVVSIGPEVQNAHSPVERARIADVQVLYDLLKDILNSAKNVP